MDHPLPALALTCTAPLLVGLHALYGIESQSLYSRREVCPNCVVGNPYSEHAPEVTRHINSKQRHRNWEKLKQRWRQVKQTWSRSGGIVWTKKRLDRALLACAAAISWGGSLCRGCSCLFVESFLTQTIPRLRSHTSGIWRERGSWGGEAPRKIFNHPYLNEGMIEYSFSIWTLPLIPVLVHENVWRILN